VGEIPGSSSADEVEIVLVKCMSNDTIVWGFCLTSRSCALCLIPESVVQHTQLDHHRVLSCD
jgi:hypothetical protein